MLSNSGLNKVDNLGILSGFPNMLRKEMRFWWGKSKLGIAAFVLSLIIVNGIVALAVWLPKEAIPEMGSSALISSLNFLLPLITIVIMLGSMIGENKMGTSEWVMSKPITRESFILSKIVGNWIGLIVTIVISQTLIALLQTLLASGSLPNVIYLLKGIGLIGLRLLFIISLMIFLGTVFNSRSIILGALLFLAIAQMILANYIHRIADWLPYVLPNTLSMVIQAKSLGQTASLDMWYLPVIAVSIYAILLVAVSMLLFKRREF